MVGNTLRSVFSLQYFLPYFHLQRINSISNITMLRGTVYNTRSTGHNRLFWFVTQAPLFIIGNLHNTVPGQFQIVHWDKMAYVSDYEALADLGGMPGTRHPLWYPILSFSHTFSLKSTHIGGPHPP